MLNQITFFVARALEDAGYRSHLAYIGPVDQHGHDYWAYPLKLTGYLGIARADRTTYRFAWDITGNARPAQALVE